MYIRKKQSKFFPVLNMTPQLQVGRLVLLGGRTALLEQWQGKHCQQQYLQQLYQYQRPTDTSATTFFLYWNQSIHVFIHRYNKNKTILRLFVFIVKTFDIVFLFTVNMLVCFVHVSFLTCVTFVIELFLSVKWRKKKQYRLKNWTKK